jgi:hypothetical protein
MRFVGHCLFAATVLLFVLWWVSLLGMFGYSVRPPQENKVRTFGFFHGRIHMRYWEGRENYPTRAGLDVMLRGVPELNQVGGRFHLVSSEGRRGEGGHYYKHFELEIPIPCLMLVTGVAAYVVLSRFRFSLRFVMLLITLVPMTLVWYSYWQPHFAQK